MEEFWNHPHFQRQEKKKQFHFMDLNRKYGHKLYIVFSMLIITHVNWTVPISFDRLLLSTSTPNLWRQDFQTQHTVTNLYYRRKSTIARINPQRRWQAWKPISLPYRPVNRNTCWTYHRLGYITIGLYKVHFQKSSRWMMRTRIWKPVRHPTDSAWKSAQDA